MTSLNTNIPLEYIKKSKKLQEIDCQFGYYILKETGKYTVWHNTVDLCGLWGKKYLPAPTIADIIDNAEILFGERELLYQSGCSCCEDEYANGYKDICEELLYLCLDNKSIEEISKYIINNIK